MIYIWDPKICPHELKVPESEGKSKPIASINHGQVEKINFISTLKHPQNNKLLIAVADTSSVITVYNMPDI